MGEKKRSSDTGRQGSLQVSSAFRSFSKSLYSQFLLVFVSFSQVLYSQASAPTCSTPTGGSGHCRDIQV